MNHVFGLPEDVKRVLKILLSSVFSEATKDAAEVTRFLNALHLITELAHRIIIMFYT